MQCTTFLMFYFILYFQGFYVACAQTASTLKYGVEKMHEIMVRELTVGIDEGCSDGQNNVKCGIVGEIGCSWPLEGNYLYFNEDFFTHCMLRLLSSFMAISLLFQILKKM